MMSPCLQWLTRRHMTFLMTSQSYDERRMLRSTLVARSSRHPPAALAATRQGRGVPAALNRAVGGAFESSDVDTLHLHHRLEGALGAGRIGVAEKGRKLALNDLPGQTVAILNPAALLGLWNR